MKKISFILFLASTIFFVSCKPKNNEEKKVETEIPLIKTMVIEKKNIDRTVTYSANIMAYEENHLAPAAAGRVDKILVDVGDVVTKGQTLVLLDRTNYNQTKIQFDKLKIDLLRMDSLYKVGGVSKQQYEQVKVQYDVTKNTLDFLEENTTLKSPINGVITGKYLNDGELFAMSPVPSIGKPAIISIMNLNSVKLLVAIPEAYFPSVKRGMESIITLDIYPNKEFKGKIDKIYPTIDNMTKTFTVEIVIPNPNQLLRPGMFAKAELNLGKVESMLVPSYAVLKQTGSNERYVFVYQNGTAVRRVVQIGVILDDMLEVVSGLNVNDELIFQGHTSLLDGMKVKKQ
ncbi:MAG TPA: efflux RND transporter periplasmic adaptor subunit [Bacteroidales bacterium]|nr:efflux RND transporter periplasmic adaptor subunit [Bacteroidales bacterium]